jgi:hypothetical protein
MVFARHFKQDALADVDLTIYSYGSNNEVLHASKRARHSTSQAESAPALLAAAFTQGHQGSADDDEQHVQLVTLPAHKIILFESEYFEAQVSVLHVWLLAVHAMEWGLQHQHWQLQ